MFEEARLPFKPMEKFFKYEVSAVQMTVAPTVDSTGRVRTYVDMLVCAFGMYPTPAESSN